MSEDAIVSRHEGSHAFDDVANTSPDPIGRRVILIAGVTARADLLEGALNCLTALALVSPDPVAAIIGGGVGGGTSTPGGTGPNTPSTATAAVLAPLSGCGRAMQLEPRLNPG
jgi:hypothetical protein